MQIEIINRRARERYGQFVSAMDMVLIALEDCKPLIERVDDGHKPAGYTVATQGELRGYWNATFDSLDDLRDKGKKYEAELVSKDWRL
ncbi:hypothetical protein [Amycolatopsis sp. NPDC004378]